MTELRLSVVIDSVDPAAIVAFWEGALGYQHSGSLPGYEVLVPAGDRPAGPVLVLQRVPEDRGGKNRVHLDVHPPDVPAHVALLETLGGRRVGAPVTDILEPAGIWWQVMADPQGNELCIVADPGHRPPS